MRKEKIDQVNYIAKVCAGFVSIYIAKQSLAFRLVITHLDFSIFYLKSKLDALLLIY
jgi:hypothetical protein